MKKMNDVLQRKVLCALLAVAAMGISVNADATFNCYVGDNNYNIKNTTKNFTQDKERTVLITDSKATQYAGVQILAWAAPGKSTSATFKKNLSIDITNTGSNPKGNTEGVTAGVHSGVFGGPKDKKLTVKSVLGTANESEVNIKAKGNQSVMGIFLEGTPKYNGPQMTINGKSLNISAESKGYYAHGIYVANNTSDLGVKDTTKLVINSENTVIHAKADTKEHEIGIATYSQGQVEVNSNLEVNAANAIVTRGGSMISINKNGDKTVKINGDILFDYDAATSGTKVDADVSINLNNADSVLNGKIYVNGNPVGSLADVNGMNLNIANGAQWNMTGDSFVNHATVKDGGQIQVGKDVTNFKADEVTLDGGELNAAGGNTTITELNASGDAKVNLDNANLSIAGGNAELSEFNASGTSSLNVSNDAKVDVAGGDATLDSVTTSGTSTLKIGSGARMKSTNGLNINDTSQVILDVGSDVEGDLRLDESAKANVKGSLKGKLLKADGTALSKDKIAETLGISDGEDVKSSMELKKENQHVKMLVDEDGNFIIQSTDMSDAGTGSVKVSALGTWDGNGNYTAGGDYNANNHRIHNVSELSTKSITLNGKDLETSLENTNQSISCVGTKVETLTNKVNDEQNGLDAANKKIETNANNIATNQGNIKKNSDAIEKNKAGIDANKTAIDNEVANRQAEDKKLADSLADTNKNVSDVTTRVDTLEGRVDTITKNQGSIQKNSEAIEKNKAGIDANKTAIDNEVANRQAEDKKLADSLADTNKNVSDVTTRVDTLEGRVDTITKNQGLTIEDHSKEITEVKKRLDNAKESIDNNTKDIQNEVAARKEADQTLQGNIDKEKEDRTAADTKLQGNIDKEISERKADVSTLSGRIDANEASISTLDRRIHDVSKEVDTVGALSMAMAGLHPLEYDCNGADFQLAAAVGNYDGTQALALGGFYHFNRDSMLSVGLATDLGSDTHKFGANLGYTIRVGHAAEVRRPSEGTVSDILKDIQELKEKQMQLEKENEELKAKLAALGK